MVSLPPNQEALKILSLDDKLDPSFEKSTLKPENTEKNEESKISGFRMFRKKISEASSLIKNKVK